MNVTFPWPPKECSPNARVHYMAKSRAAKHYRNACWALALEAKVKATPGPIPIALEFIPPKGWNHGDQDNLVARMKSGLDGLADALRVDDALFRLTHSISLPVGAGEVRVVLG